MTNKQREIDELRHDIREVEDYLIKLKKRLDMKVKTLQECCVHREFFAEDNGDFHRRGYYYVCSECGYLTCSKPSGIVIYS